MKNFERLMGFAAALIVLIGAKFLLKTDILFFRLLVGTGIGYALARAYTGFAGSVNRAYRTGSTKLMRTLMFMFFITALLTTAFLFGRDPASYNLWINPINAGLLLGGFFFGFGMSLSVCCASGVLTDLPVGLPRAFITLIFFGMGVFLGFPIQNTASWVRESWYSTYIGYRTSGGVFLPDLFQGDGFEGYLGGLAVLGGLCLLFTVLSYFYEQHKIKTGKYSGLPIEKVQDEVDSIDLNNFKLFSSDTYYHFFEKPWTLKQGGIVLALIFTLMMGITGAGWGASTPYGIWFGKFLMIFGISAESLAEFTHMSAGVFDLPFFEHQISVQNFGIVVGAVIYLLTAAKLSESFTAGLNISKKEVLLYALGGITMGLGTRFANGCNVGALYTPIANFSLSGWFFLVFMIIGGVVSNKFTDKIYG
ncbi:MAG: YeeE/YedE family protein [Bacillota bacterium]